MKLKMRESNDDRYKSALNIAYFVFGAPELDFREVDDRLDLIGKRFFKDNNRIYDTSTPEELADILSNYPIGKLKSAEYSLCIDDESTGIRSEAYAYNLDNKESRRKEIADRFGKSFIPDDHMLVCKDGKLMNVQVGKKYKCTVFNGQRVEIVSIDTLYPEDEGDSASITAFYRGNMYSIGSNQLYESFNRLHEQDVEIEVKHEGILEVPEGKNVDDLPISHFEKLAKKKGLSKITRALNNLQVWNKNDDPKLSKWAGDMIDKLNKRMGF